MMSSTLKTYLKTYLKTKEDKAKNDEEEKMLKDTLCRKITFYLIHNFLKNIFNNFYEKKSLKLILTRLGIFNFVLIIVEKELFENETDNSTNYFK